MRTALLAAILGSTALAATALAQGQLPATPDSAPEGQVRAKAALAECDRLIAFLDASRPTAGVTVDQARTWQRESNVDACKTALDRITRASAPDAPGGA